MKEQESVLYEAHVSLAGERASYRLFSFDDGLCLTVACGREHSSFDLSGVPVARALSFVRALAESETAPCMIPELFEEAFP